MYLNRLGCCRDPETSFWLLFSNLYRRQPVLVTVPYTRIKPSDIGRAPQSSLDCPDDRYGSNTGLPFPYGARFAGLRRKLGIP